MDFWTVSFSHIIFFFVSESTGGYRYRTSPLNQELQKIKWLTVHHTQKAVHLEHSLTSHSISNDRIYNHVLFSVWWKSEPIGWAISEIFEKSTVWFHCIIPSLTKATFYLLIWLVISTKCRFSASPNWLILMLWIFWSVALKTCKFLLMPRV